MEMNVQLIHVTKKFKAFTALSDVNAYFEAGKIHGIIGRNGSGKTVMFKCICGLLQTYDGRILIGSNDRKKHSSRIPQIGMIIEAPGFVSGYNGFTNLKFLADIKKGASTKEIIEAMCLVGLDPFSKKHVEKYSMGMRQRLGIAQAIMEDPSLIVLDEPMNGLDNGGVTEIRKLFKNLRAAGKTLILASHNPLDIDELCDTVHEMDAGILRPSFAN